MAGDFNLAPAQLEEYARALGGRVLTPDRATCVTAAGASTIDYGIASRALADRLVGCVADLE
eukprot:8165170-Lingulodinium_polyedra.AAC.1